MFFSVKQMGPCGSNWTEALQQDHFGIGHQTPKTPSHGTSLQGLLRSSEATFLQGSLHYTAGHCLVNGGFPVFWC